MRIIINFVEEQKMWLNKKIKKETFYYSFFELLLSKISYG